MKKTVCALFISLVFIFVFILVSVSSNGVLMARQADDEAVGRLKELPPGPARVECLIDLVKGCRNTDPAAAVEYGKEALALLRDFPDENAAVKLNYYLLWVYKKLGDYPSALDAGLKAEKAARSVGDKKWLAAALTSIGVIYKEYSHLNQSLYYSLEALKLFEALKNNKGMGSTHTNLGLIYRKMGEHKQALHHLAEALGYLKSMPADKRRTANIAGVLSNTGIVYLNLRDYSRSLEHFSQSLVLMRELGNKTGEAAGLGNIATVYNNTGRYEEALPYNLKALKLSRETGDRRQIAQALQLTGVTYRNLGQYDKALAYMHDALETAKPLGAKTALLSFYRELAVTCEAMGNHSDALSWYKEYKDANDEVFRGDRRRQIALMEVKYETEKKEKEIQLLTRSNEIREWQRNFFILLSGFVIILALVIYHRYLGKKKTERILRESEDQLKRINAAKDRLFSIVAHDLGGPLNSLLMTADHLQNHYDALEKTDVKEFIHNIHKQSTSVSDLLENLLEWAFSQLGKMESNPQEIDIQLLADETIEQIDYAAGKKNIRVSAHIMENTVAWADRQMMKTVLRNLLSNAVKYTRPGGEVKILSRETGEGIEVIVSDNGVGMSKEKKDRLFNMEIHDSSRGTADEKGTGLGLVLCKEFVEKNGGKIHVDSEPEQGSRFSFTMPGPSAGEANVSSR